MKFQRHLPTVLGVLAMAIASMVATQSSAEATLKGSISNGATATATALRVDPPDPVTPLPNRPRVFMALHGNKQLANNPALDSQWRFVQENLDGIWGNPVGLDAQEIGRLINKVDTRQFIAEAGLPPAGTPFAFPTTMSDFRYIEQQNPGIHLNREAIALYTDRPSDWDGKSIQQMRDEIQRISPPGSPIYPAVYTGWQPYNFLTTDSRQIRPGSSAERALDAGEGIFVECPSRACAEPENGLGPNFRAAIQEAHANGRPFIWFASRPPSLTGPGWLSQFQLTYNSIRDAGLWKPGDIVVVISYEGTYPVVPETVNGQPADTIMGAIYWALRQ